MTSDWLAITGGVLQMVALGWAWIALYRLWRLRWPGATLSPGFKGFWGQVTSPFLAMWHWLTLPRGRTYDIRFDEVVGMSDSTGDTSLTKGGTVEEKVASLQEQLLAAEASFNRRLVELRATVEKAVARVTDDQSAKWASADEQTKADTRRALTWPALFAALGGACQIAAALFDAWS